MPVASATLFGGTAIADFVPEDLAKRLTDEVMARLVQDTASYARAEWVRLGIAHFKSGKSQNDYVSGIQPLPGDGPLTATVALVGALPNRLENGQEPYDMHDTLLGSRVPTVEVGSGQKGKHATETGGFYRSIPFRHSGAASSGATGAPLGSAYKNSPGVDASALGKLIEKSARKLKATVGMPGQGTTYGGVLPAGLAPKLKPHHATDIYAGMIRSQKTYARATQSTFSTFRTISSGSEGWRHPGSEGAKLLPQVEAFIREQVPKIVEGYFQK